MYQLLLNPSTLADSDCVTLMQDYLALRNGTITMEEMHKRWGTYFFADGFSMLNFKHIGERKVADEMRAIAVDSIQAKRSVENQANEMEEEPRVKVEKSYLDKMAWENSLIIFEKGLKEMQKDALKNIKDNDSF